jgi:rare lipoprotein A
VLGELKWLTQSLSSQSGGDKVRLHLGPFESADEARRVADKIARAIKLKPFLVTR